MKAGVSPFPTTDVERLFALSQDLLCVAGADGYFKRVNPAFTRTLGWPEATLLARPFLQFVHPDDQARTLAQVQALADGTPVHGFENRYRCADGSWRWISWSITPEPDEHLVYAVGRDITEQRDLEEALRAGEARFRAVIEQCSDLIRILSAESVLQYASPSHLHVLGYAPEELLDRPSPNFIHPEDVEHARAEFAAVVAQGGTRRVTLRMRHRDGGYRTLEGVLHNRLDDPAVRGVVVTSRDITERTRAQAALQAGHQDLERSNAELAQFAYVASHDLQEPLRTITSYLQLLQRRYQGKPLDATAEEFIAYAVEGAGRMQALIRDVLAYSRVGTHGAAFALVDCAAVVGQVLATLRATVAEKGAVVRSEGLPVVWGDATQVGQLFQNLIGNALKFCHRPPEVTIAAERDGAWWLLRVADNGIGIDPEHAGRIFEMFKRLHTRAEYEGTGIGLAVCKRIVERHGGRIWVESQPGQGATFFFTLPHRPEGD